MTTRPRPHIARPHVIVLGNEKGGSGKSTTAVHLTVALLHRGFSVGCLDLDARQATLTRYLENRQGFAEASGLTLPMPQFQSVPRSQASTRAEIEAEELHGFGVARAALGPVDYLVIDTPGSDNCLSRLGHSQADTLITPLNDSFLDLDLLARIDPANKSVVGPSIYSQMVWEQRQRRASEGRQPFDWVVMRNRLTHIDSRSKREIADLLDIMGERLHFRVVSGFGERVIYRDLFLKGLTLLDLREEEAGVALKLSHVAARQELRALLQAIGLPDEFDELPDEAPVRVAGVASAGH